MTPLFRKLNLGDRTVIVVIQAPPSFEAELEAVEVDVLSAIPCDASASFVLAFVQENDDVARVAAQLGDVPGDAVVWFAYPKRSSKQYTSGLSRDTGWAPLGEAGFEPVRQVAVDEDWSALRFRRVAFIRTLRRDPSRALSTEGRSKAREERS